MSTYSNRLYDHFQRERSAFWRSVVAVISIGVFFAFVFQPYLATLADLVDLDVELAQQAEQIADVQDGIRTATSGIQRAIDFMGDASAYSALYEETDAWVDDLDGIERVYDRQSRRVASLHSALSPEDQAAWQPGKKPPTRIIRELRELRPAIMANYELRDDCFFRLEDDWVRCFIAGKLTPIHNRLERVLYDRTQSHDFTRKLEDPIRANQENYEQGLAAALARAELAKWVRTYLDEENKIIRRWYEAVARERLELIREGKQQETLLAQNQEQRTSLEIRKTAISQTGKLDTPIGSLPLAFLDLLTLLPLILLATASMLLRSQSRLLELHRNFARHGPTEETEPDALRLTLPMWLDSPGGGMAGIFVLILILVPGIAALFGIGQLVTNPGLNIGPLQLNATIAATIGAAAIYAVLYVKLCMAWRRDNN